MSVKGLQGRFQGLRAAVCGDLVEREGDVDAALRALLSSSTMFMLGEPGVAKSFLARRLNLYVAGGEYFDLSLDKFTTPDDVFGPRSLAALKQGRWEREHEGTLVTADWGMLDEFFEASSALLKALLRALNEREVRQGTEVIPMRLTTLLTAANEVPHEKRLWPLYDRLLIRRRVDRIRDDEAFVRMLRMECERAPEPLVSWADVVAARQAVAAVPVPMSLLEAMAKIRAALAAEDIRLSDRRFKAALPVVQATAWLDGESTADASHLRALYDICWSHPDQIETVWRVIDQVVDPILLEYDKLSVGIREIDDQIKPTDNEKDRRNLAVELHDKLMIVERDLSVLEQENRGGSARRQEKLGQMRHELKRVTRRIMVELFDIQDKVA